METTMETMSAKSDKPAAPATKQIWTGRILSGLTVLFLIFDSAVKLVQSHWALEATVQLGYSERVVLPLGIVLLASTLLYALPRTSILGAILLTGYLGGATATHVRVGQPFVFPIVFGVLVWLGLWLRDARLRALIPALRSEP
jgi:hypothetical protein